MRFRCGSHRIIERISEAYFEKTITPKNERIDENETN
jgi:hypothetical protein